MLSISRLTLLSALFLLIIPISACKNKETPPAASTRVSATRAYERYFGPAPTTDRGTCYAFVIYFPSAREQGKVVPFPFFTFDEGSMMKVAAERLLGGMEVAGYSGEFIQAFPLGTRLLGVSREEGRVTANFSREILDGKAEAASGTGALNALVLTLSQFTGVREVRVQVEGKDAERILGAVSLKKEVLVPNETVIQQPSPPRLLSVTAVKDKGAKSVEDVSAYFDRPVEVQELSMSDQRGNLLAGDLFHAVFDMAAVLKPKEPGLFTARMPIRVRWKVTDKLGRHAEGDKVFPLDVKEH